MTLSAVGLRSAPGLALVLSALSACSALAADLEEKVEGKPGVAEVSAAEDDVADDDIPFATIPKLVAVVMEEDATPEEVMAVFGEYDDAINDGDVVSVEVTFADSKMAALSSGEDVHVTQEHVEDLLDAQADAAVAAYRHEAYPVLPSVRLTLNSGDFSEVVSRVDYYTNRPDLENGDRLGW